MSEPSAIPAEAESPPTALSETPRDGHPTITIECWVEMGAIHGSGQSERHEIDREWWESLTEQEQDDALASWGEDHIANQISGGAYVVEDGSS